MFLRNEASPIAAAAAAADIIHSPFLIYIFFFSRSPHRGAEELLVGAAARIGRGCWSGKTEFMHFGSCG